MELLLYLGGPIIGCNYEECTSWRDYVAQKLPSFITAISPLRGKDYLNNGQVIAKGVYEQYLLTSRKGIVTRDRFDVMRADALLMNLLGATSISVGSIIEIGWGDAFRKPIIMAMEDENVHSHVMTREMAGFITPTLDEAIDIAIAVLCPDLSCLTLPPLF